MTALPKQRYITDRLPITGSITLAYIFSLIVTLLMTGTSLAGVLYTSSIYPTEEVRQTFLPNDVVNLIIAVPILLLSMWWARRGKLIGLLFWPGALFYALYNYLVYMLATPLGIPFVLYLTLVTLSLYTIIGLVGAIDGQAVQQRLAGTVSERWAGGILAGLGALFVFRVIGVIGSAIATDTSIPATEAALLTTDFLINPAWMIGGVLLWRQRSAGYVIGLGLLFQGSMLFIGLIGFLLIQPILTNAPFAPIDIVVIFGMGLVVFIPFAVFARAACGDQ